jgi:hypothetical protein
MQRYSMTSSLPAIRLFPPHETDKAGVMSLLPAKAVVEIRGQSELGDGMIEVTWHCQRSAVLQRHLLMRATLVDSKRLVSETDPDVYSRHGILFRFFRCRRDTLFESCRHL